jgi:site-specific DNA-methyltransferase (cytosine-N4-specific)
MLRSDLPFASEFSPSQIHLSRVLSIANDCSGSQHSFENTIRKEYFEDHDTNDYNKGKLANNTYLSMRAYGIIDSDVNFTDLGKQLYAIKDDEEQLYTVFARHILLNLHGITLIQCIQDMQAAGVDINLVDLRTWLLERGIVFPRGGKHPSIMRLWLAMAGIFTSRWNINESRLQAILGTDSNEIEILAQFTQEQKAYLKTLLNMGSDSSYFSNDIEKLATATYGVKFNEKNLPKSVLYPLQEAGYITLTRGTKEQGRGAKPFVVVPTDKLFADFLLPLLEQLEKQVSSDIRPLLRKPLSTILEEMNNEDKYIRGLALEALAFKLMKLVDLTYIATRLRGIATGGAEVDLVFEASRLVFSRWQVQCKNTSRVSLDDVAKEVGLTHLLKSNVIVVVSTGEIGKEARRYSNKVMQDSNLCIVMVDKTDILTIEKNPSAIVDVFNREAVHTMKLKALDI